MIKVLFLFLGIPILMGMVFFGTGCGNLVEKARQTEIDNKLRSVQRNGHTYLLTEGGLFDSGRVIHDESCWCKKMERARRFKEK